MAHYSKFVLDYLMSALLEWNIPAVEYSIFALMNLIITAPHGVVGFQCHNLRMFHNDYSVLVSLPLNLRTNIVCYDFVSCLVNTLISVGPTNLASGCKMKFDWSMAEGVEKWLFYQFSNGCSYNMLYETVVWRKLEGDGTSLLDQEYPGTLVPWLLTVHCALKTDEIVEFIQSLRLQ